MLIFWKKSFTITNETNKQVIAKILMFENHMYMLKIQPKMIKCLKSTTNLAWLWHRICGHIKFNSLKGLTMLVRGMPIFSLPLILYVRATFMGNNRENFSSHSHLTKAPLELVHVDIYRPMQNPTLAKCKYMLFFIDDYFRMIWLYLLQAKSYAFESFVKFKALVEKQSSYYLKKFQTNHGGEFTLNEFNTFYNKHGIKQ